MSHFEITDATGERVYFRPAVVNAHQPTEAVAMETETGRPVYFAVDQLEDVIAGMRDVRRQAAGQPAAECALPTFMGCECNHLSGCQHPAAGQPADDEQLVHIGWWCWRGNGHGHLATQACRSDNVPLHVPAEWADDMTAVIQRIEDDDPERAAGQPATQQQTQLTATDRAFLNWALDQAAHVMASDGAQFDNDGHASMARLRRVADEAAQ